MLKSPVDLVHFFEIDMRHSPFSLKVSFGPQKDDFKLKNYLDSFDFK